MTRSNSTASVPVISFSASSQWLSPSSLDGWPRDKQVGSRAWSGSPDVIRDRSLPELSSAVCGGHYGDEMAEIPCRYSPRRNELGCCWKEGGVMNTPRPADPAAACWSRAGSAFIRRKTFSLSCVHGKILQTLWKYVAFLWRDYNMQQSFCSWVTTDFF